MFMKLYKKVAFLKANSCSNVLWKIVIYMNVEILRILWNVSYIFLAFCISGQTEWNTFYMQTYFIRIKFWEHDMCCQKFWFKTGNHTWHEKFKYSYRIFHITIIVFNWFVSMLLIRDWNWINPVYLNLL